MLVCNDDRFGSEMFLGRMPDARLPTNDDAVVVPDLLVCFLSALAVGGLLADNKRGRDAVADNDDLGKSTGGVAGGE